MDRGAESTDRGTICRRRRLPCDGKERSTNARQVGGRRQETCAELWANSKDTAVREGARRKTPRTPRHLSRGVVVLSVATMRRMGGAKQKKPPPDQTSPEGAQHTRRLDTYPHGSLTSEAAYPLQSSLWQGLLLHEYSCPAP